MSDTASTSGSTPGSTPGSALGGTLDLAEGLTINRLGYGTMQLAGPNVMGPPADPDEAVAVLRTAVELGINNIDTSDYYGPYVVNELVKKALYPYPEDLHIVTKVGAQRGPNGSWDFALSPADLTSAVHDNLRRLGLDALDVVNLRLDPEQGPNSSLAEPLGTLVELQQAGLIRYLGVSEVSMTQLVEAQSLTQVVCVQNLYNIVHRKDDPMVELCANERIAFMPYFPLGGFTPIESHTLQNVADRLHATPHQVAIAWLLQRSPTMAPIPGTSSVAHLRENVAAASLELPEDAVALLDSLWHKPEEGWY